jgi:predicted metal-dependent phosphoesterase TrpH
VKRLALKLDLHVHTCYSPDALTTLEEVVLYSKKRGLDGVAITDHDTIDGALRLRKEKELIIIPGVEVSTLEGHVLALNITQSIPPGLTIHETTRRIHEAGGIAIAAHPSVFYKKMNRVDSSLDAIEVINASAFPFLLSTYLNRKLARRLDLPQTAGSDAHHAPEIGFAYTLIHADPEVEEIVQAIKEGAIVPVGKPIPWRLRLERESLSLKKWF